MPPSLLCNPHHGLIALCIHCKLLSHPPPPPPSFLHTPHPAPRTTTPPAAPPLLPPHRTRAPNPCWLPLFSPYPPVSPPPLQHPPCARRCRIVPVHPTPPAVPRPPACARATYQLSDFPTSRQADKLESWQTPPTSRRAGERHPHPAAPVPDLAHPALTLPFLAPALAYTCTRSSSSPAPALPQPTPSTRAGCPSLLPTPPVNRTPPAAPNAANTSHPRLPPGKPAPARQTKNPLPSCSPLHPYTHPARAPPPVSAPPPVHTIRQLSKSPTSQQADKPESWKVGKLESWKVGKLASARRTTRGSPRT